MKYTLHAIFVIVLLVMYACDGLYAMDHHDRLLLKQLHQNLHGYDESVDDHISSSTKTTSSSFMIHARDTMSGERTIRIGASLGLESDVNDQYGPVQYHSFEGLQVWMDAFNAWPVSNRTTKYGETIRFELDVFENYGRFSFNNPSHEIALRDQVLAMSYNTSLDYIIPPVGSPWGTVLRNASYLTGQRPFTIGIADSREFWYRLPGSYGAPTSSLFVMSSALPYLRINGAKTAYVIRMQETFQAELCQGFLNQAPYNDIQVVHVENVYFDYNTFGNPSSDADREMWNRITDDLIAKNADVMVMCDYGEASEYAIRVLREKNYTPKSILLSYKYAEFKDPTLVDYVTIPFGYHRDANYPRQANFMNAREYDDLIQTRYQHPANIYNAHATLTGFLLSNAILLADNNSTQAVENALRTAQFPSFMGISRYDPQRRQLMDNVIIQRSDSQDQVIGPALAARTTMIYPMPTWEQRVFKVQWGHPSEIIGLTLMLICTLISLGWLIFVFMHWNSKPIKAASPVFCVVIIFGSIVMYASNITWMPNLVSETTCILRAWLLPLGFMMMFGALIAKTHRVHQLYFTEGLNVIRISNLRVAIPIALLLLIQIGFSIMMMYIADIRSQRTVVDPWRVSLNFYTCTSKSSLRILYGFNMALTAILLIYGCIIAFPLRNIPLRIYDESKIIIGATYITVFCTIIASILQIALGQSQRFWAYIILSICMFLGPMVTVTLLFGSKYYAIYHGLDSKVSTELSSSTSSPTRKDRSKSIPKRSTEYQGARYDYSLKSMMSMTANTDTTTSPSQDASESKTSKTHLHAPIDAGEVDHSSPTSLERYKTIINEMTRYQDTLKSRIKQLKKEKREQKVLLDRCLEQLENNQTNPSSNDKQV